jgi:hypothetical protein
MHAIAALGMADGRSFELLSGMKMRGGKGAVNQMRGGSFVDGAAVKSRR